MYDSFVTSQTVVLLGPLSVGFLKQEYWSGWPCPSPADRPDSGIKPVPPESRGDSLLLSHHVVAAAVAVQWLSHVGLLATPWTTALQGFLSFTTFWSLFKLMSIELMTPSKHLNLCPLLLLSSIFPGIRVFSNTSFLQKLNLSN